MAMVTVPDGIQQLTDWMQRRCFTRADTARYFDVPDFRITQIMGSQDDPSTRTAKPGLKLALKIERLTGIPVEAWVNPDEDQESAPQPKARKRRLAK